MMDEVDRRMVICRTLCRSGKFETGEGTCAARCMDQLGDARKPLCLHEGVVHGALADQILLALDTGEAPRRRR